MTAEARALAVVHSTLLADEDATLALGGVLARGLTGAPTSGQTVFLIGQLGAGKTTFARGLLRALGHTGSVKSPTYTLLEPYELDGATLYHFDLYRVSDPVELDLIGIDEYFDGSALSLVEWPDAFFDRLPEPDVVVRLEVAGRARHAEVLATPGALAPDVLLTLAENAR